MDAGFTSKTLWPLSLQPWAGSSPLTPAQASFAPRDEQFLGRMTAKMWLCLGQTVLFPEGMGAAV